MGTIPNAFDVTFKPVGADYASRKFPAIPANLDKHISEHSVVYIPKYNGSFEVAIRGSGNIKLPPGSGVLFEISMQGLSSKGTSGTFRRLLGATNLERGLSVIGKHSSKRKHGGRLEFTTNGFKNGKWPDF
jgi:hypothetical protein